MFSLDERDPHDQKTFCNVCQSWRHSPFSCGRDDCGRPNTPTMQREVAKALSDLKPTRDVDQLEELLTAYWSTCQSDREWFWLDEIENRIGRKRYHEIMSGR